jgi:glutamyl/glutaminyl-tRNA synthetase
MAWSFPGGRDIFSVDEMIKAFNLEDIQTSAPIFDVEKLKWLNGKYLKESDINTFFNGKYPEDKVKEIWPLVKERMRVLPEFESLAGFFFTRPAKAKVNVGIVSALKNCQWNHDAMEKAIRDAAQKAGVKAKDLFMDLRVAVTGKQVGPPLLESLEILGKEETMARIAI